MALYAFDGTSREDELDNEKDTNIVRFARAYRGARFYRAGVGTRYGGVGGAIGGWTGAGLHQRVREALAALKQNMARGDRDIDVIGFSRGAAAARHFVNQVWEEVGGRRPDSPVVRFLGLFDTVASTGVIPGPVDIALDLDLPPNVRKCCHALALDEGRAAFAVQRVEPRKGTQAAAGVIEEVWFRGCHSDIGGGEGRDSLANITLCWMLRRAADVGVRFDAREVAAAVDERDATASIRRAKLDRGLKKRRVLPGDLVHCSVSQREKVGKLWHVNPPVGCGLVGDSGEARGQFPGEAGWPFPIDWAQALQPPMTLQPSGAPVTLEVFADAEWNETPQVHLERGGLYRFEVVEGPHDWVDGAVTVTNGAEGYDLPVLEPFEHLKRLPGAEWYALVGAIDRAEYFRIGSGCEHRATRGGDFGCFANDAWFKYDNNRGRLVLSIQRLE